MCFLCSDGISQDIRRLKMKNILEDEDSSFDKFNTTSLYVILYSCTGMYGKEAKELGIKVLKNFVKWMNKNNKIYYLPKTGLEIMYHPDLIEEILNWCETLPINETIDNDQKHKMMEELSKKFRELEVNFKSKDLNYFVLDKYNNKKQRLYYYRYLFKSDDYNRFITSVVIGGTIGFIGSIIYAKFIK